MESQDKPYPCRRGCSRSFETEEVRDRHERTAPHDEPQFELVDER